MVIQKNDQNRGNPTNIDNPAGAWLNQGAGGDTNTIDLHISLLDADGKPVTDSDIIPLKALLFYSKAGKTPDLPIDEVTHASVEDKSGKITGQRGVLLVSGKPRSLLQINAAGGKGLVSVRILETSLAHDRRLFCVQLALDDSADDRIKKLFSRDSNGTLHMEDKTARFKSMSKSIKVMSKINKTAAKDDVASKVQTQLAGVVKMLRPRSESFDDQALRKLMTQCDTLRSLLMRAAKSNNVSLEGTAKSASGIELKHTGNRMLEAQGHGAGSKKREAALVLSDRGGEKRTRVQAPEADVRVKTEDERILSRVDDLNSNNNNNNFNNNFNGKRVGGGSNNNGYNDALSLLQSPGMLQSPAGFDNLATSGIPATSAEAAAAIVSLGGKGSSIRNGGPGTLQPSLSMQSIDILTTMQSPQLQMHVQQQQGAGSNNTSMSMPSMSTPQPDGAAGEWQSMSFMSPPGVMSPPGGLQQDGNGSMGNGNGAMVNSNGSFDGGKGGMGNSNAAGNNLMNAMNQTGVLDLRDCLFEELFSMLQDETREFNIIGCNLSPEGLFFTLDLSQEGWLNEGEVEHALKVLKIPLSSRIAKEVMCACDLDKDGKISKEEFLHFLRLREAQLQTTFNEIDRDSDGFITLEELQQARDSQLIQGSDADLQALIEWMDGMHGQGPKNGRIDFEEFKTSLTLLPPSTTLTRVIEMMRAGEGGTLA